MLDKTGLDIMENIGDLSPFTMKTTRLIFMRFDRDIHWITLEVFDRQFVSVLKTFYFRTTANFHNFSIFQNLLFLKLSFFLNSHEF